MKTVSFSKMNSIKTMNRKTMTIKAEKSNIKLCKDCIHYSEKEDTCKALSLINHTTKNVSNIKSLYCRTREDLCGMDAKYYESKYYSLKTQFVGAKSINDNIVYEHYEITYNPDGSSGICGEGCDIDIYYNNIQLDYVDVY
jgi:hypothetical protein